MTEAGALSRRKALAVFGVGAAALIAEQALAADGSLPGKTTASAPPPIKPVPGGYAPDGVAGRTAARHAGGGGAAG